MFNALRYIKNLEAVGFGRDQAEAQVQFVLDAIEVEVATKTDIAEIRADMSSLRSEVRADMSSLRSEVRTEFAQLRSEMSEFKADIVFKLGTMTIGSVTMATGILGFLIKF